MNQYEKPLIMVNEEVAEGVYAASGCWTVRVKPGQKFSDNERYFEVKVVHGSNENHGQGYTVIAEVSFNRALSDVSASMGSASVMGSTVTVTFSNANANPNENMTSNVKVTASGTGAALACTGSSVTYSKN